LVVDDDAALRTALSVGLAALGHEVMPAETGSDGVAQLARWRPDAVIVDLDLTDTDGIDVCRWARALSRVPIVVLSTAGVEERIAAALDGGADDYVTKPFDVAELEARLEVALRRVRRHPADEACGEITVGGLVVDLVHHEALKDGRPLDLTAREFDVLAYLARNAGKICTYHMLLEEIWGPERGADTHYLRVYAHRIRHKLGTEDGRLLRTHPGIGYQLVAR
jgi:two-component system KDP operon response regulator KdpE